MHHLLLSSQAHAHTPTTGATQRSAEEKQSPDMQTSQPSPASRPELFCCLPFIDVDGIDRNTPQPAQNCYTMGESGYDPAMQNMFELGYVSAKSAGQAAQAAGQPSAASSSANLPSPPLSLSSPPSNGIFHCNWATPGAGAVTVQQQQQWQQRAAPPPPGSRPGPLAVAQAQKQLLLLQHQMWSLQHQAQIIEEQQQQQQPSEPLGLNSALSGGLLGLPDLSSPQQQLAAAQPSSAAGGGRRSRGASASGGPDALAAAPPLTKSGSSSRRHRERQRSLLAGLESEVTERLARLELLGRQNSLLRLRGSVLEAAVASREDQMRVTQEHGPPVYDAADDAASCPAAAGAGAQELDPAAAAAAGGGGGDTPAAAGAAAAGGCAMQSAGSCSAAGLHAAAAAAAAAEGGFAAGSPCGPGSSSSGSYPGSPTTGGSSPEQQPQHRRPLEQGRPLTVKQMTVTDVIFHWREFLLEARQALVDLEEQQQQQQQQQAPSAAAAVAGSSPAQQRLDALVDRATFLVKTAQTLNPGAYYRLFGRNLETGEPAPYSDTHWRQVVAALALDPDQTSHILACAEIYFSQLSTIQSERRQLTQQIKASDAKDLAAVLRDPSRDQQEVKAWLEQLAANIKREHVLRVMLNSFVWGRIFAPVQCAKAAVHSHPFYVDVHALACVMYEDALQAQAGAAAAAPGAAATAASSPAAAAGAGGSAFVCPPRHSHPAPAILRGGSAGGGAMMVA